MRALGVDLGMKRIGIAIGEADPGIATSRKPVRASGTLAKDADEIVKIAAREQADVIVVGVPRNPDGSDRMERVCLTLVDLLTQRGATVYSVDEAFSSIEGARNLSDVYKAGAGRKHKNLDGEAARLILERFFNGES